MKHIRCFELNFEGHKEARFAGLSGIRMFTIILKCKTQPSIAHIKIRGGYVNQGKNLRLAALASTLFINLVTRKVEKIIDKCETDTNS